MKNKYRIKNDLVYIEMRKMDSPNIEFIIDVEDLPKMLSLDVRWHEKLGYASASVVGENGRTKYLTYAHRYIMDTPQDMITDHIDFNGLNNRKSNLQNVSKAENMLHKVGAYKTSKSGIRGVSWDISKERWQVYVCKYGKSHFGGRFEDIKEAEKAAKKLRESLQMR